MIGTTHFKKLPQLSLTSEFAVWKIPLIVAVIVGLLTVLVLLPQGAAVLELRGNLRVLREQLVRLSEKADTLASLDQEELERNVALAERGLPSHKPVFETLSSLGNQAGRAGVTIVGYQLSPGELATESGEAAEDITTNASGLLEMLIEATVLGDFTQIAAYLDVLRSTAPLVDVTGLSLTTVASEGGQLTNQSELTLSSYYALPPETIGEPSQPLAEFSDAAVARLKFLSGLEFLGTSEATAPGNVGKTNPFGF